MLWNCPSIYAEEEWYISLCMNSILQPTLDWSKFSMCSMKLQDKSSTLKFGNWKGQHFLDYSTLEDMKFLKQGILKWITKIYRLTWMTKMCFSCWLGWRKKTRGP